MILGIDHIALSVVDTALAKQRLELDNYTCSFIESGIQNDIEKKLLLNHYQPTHDLGFFKPNDKGLCVEITNHGHVSAGHSSFNFDKDSIELICPNLDVEKKFWMHVLKFQEVSDQIMKFTSHIPQWSCMLKLTENPEITIPTLDSPGYNCLAFLTSNLERDIQTAQQAGAWDIIRLDRFQVNQRNVDIGMFRTPGGAICELIKILQ